MTRTAADNSSLAPGYPGTVTVDLDALAHNYRTMRDRADGATVLCVVKANAYGAGLGPAALRLWDEGARWFGVARVPEALKLRDQLAEAGRDVSAARIFTWLADPDAPHDEAVAAGFDISASSVRELEQIASAAENLTADTHEGQRAGKPNPVKVHLKVDVGMARAGARREDWDALATKARELEDQRLIVVVGVWSHLPQADDPDGAGRAVTDRQIAHFAEACEYFEARGLKPVIRHLEATAGTLWFPTGHFDMVRIGIGLYGLSPNPQVASSQDLGLRPVIRYTTRVQGVKLLQPGDSVSYGATWTAKAPHWVGLLPVGYADGVSRGLSNGAPVTVKSQDGPVETEIVGRVCMDQTVISLGNRRRPAGQVGDTVVLFGDPFTGEPGVERWAAADQTVNYEVIAALPASLPRHYLPARPEGTL